ncbi:hypothetical protein [Chishuiella sp.]|uniref:hypothetical protein n=1 Tax=Chishuiella sp. TaxID=1969467 RepID=UPI0028A8DA72|nr:hypothetical protein [Chishuiella sp.]
MNKDCATNKKIFIQTDFSIYSLNILNTLLKESTDTIFNIVLIHGYQSTKSFKDLLFHSKQNILEKLETIEFIEAYEVIKNAHESIISEIRIDIIPFKKKSYIKNYFQSNDIDFFIISKNYQLNFIHKNSFDLQPFINSSSIQKKEIEINPIIISNFEHYGIISELFN